MTRIITSIASAASIISLALATNLPSFIRILIGIVGVVGLGVLVVNDIKSQSENERTCHSEDEIRSTMKELIKSQGKVCIMSRDLSWVDADVENCILEKKNSVRVFVEQEVELTKRLREQGVQVKYYGHLGFEPKTRFTVIRYNRDNPQVAIANTENTLRKKKKFTHAIYETRDNSCKQDKWINSLAVDMVTLCNIVFDGSECVAEDFSEKSE